jgi:hypothetical protein
MLGGLRRARFGILAGNGGASRNIFWCGGEVVHQDVIGPWELFGHDLLSVGDLGRGTSADNDQSEQK